MAIPRLADMAALTLFHNPHMQPEDVSVPFGEGYSAPARRIQRYMRRRSRARGTISKIMRGYFARLRTFIGEYYPAGSLQALRSRRGRWRAIMPPGLIRNTPAGLRHNNFDLVIRRRNIRAAWNNYNRTARTRTHPNPPLV